MSENCMTKKNLNLHLVVLGSELIEFSLLTILTLSQDLNVSDANIP